MARCVYEACIKNRRDCKDSCILCSNLLKTGTTRGEGQSRSPGPGVGAGVAVGRLRGPCAVSLPTAHAWATEFHRRSASISTRRPNLPSRLPLDNTTSPTKHHPTPTPPTPRRDSWGDQNHEHSRRDIDFSTFHEVCGACRQARGTPATAAAESATRHTTSPSPFNLDLRHDTSSRPSHDPQSRIAGGLGGTDKHGRGLLAVTTLSRLPRTSTGLVLLKFLS